MYKCKNCLLTVKFYKRRQVSIRAAPCRPVMLRKHYQCLKKGSTTREKSFYEKYD